MKMLEDLPLVQCIHFLLIEVEFNIISLDLRTLFNHFKIVMHLIIFVCDENTSTYDLQIMSLISFYTSLLVIILGNDHIRDSIAVFK